MSLNICGVAADNSPGVLTAEVTASHFIPEIQKSYPGGVAISSIFTYLKDTRRGMVIVDGIVIMVTISSCNHARLSPP